MLLSLHVCTCICVCHGKCRVDVGAGIMLFSQHVCMCVCVHAFVSRIVCHGKCRVDVGAGDVVVEHACVMESAVRTSEMILMFSSLCLRVCVCVWEVYMHVCVQADGTSASHLVCARTYTRTLTLSWIYSYTCCASGHTYHQDARPQSHVCVHLAQTRPLRQYCVCSLPAD
jgi:hypothetical protein